MSLLRSLAERRSAEDPRYPLTSQTVIDMLTAGTTSDAGVSVTPDTAMRQSAVYRCVSLIAGAVAGLPLHTYADGTRKRVDGGVVDRPHPDLTPYEFKELEVYHLLLRGNFYAEKIRNGLNEIVDLWPMHPDAVEPKRVKPSKANPSGKVFEITLEGGSKVEMTPDKVFHVPGLGYDGLKGLSVIEAHRQGIGLAMAAEKFGALFFGQGSMMSGILTTDKKLDDVGAESLKQRWKKKVTGLNKSHEIAVLDSGAKFQPVSLSPSDSQFIETRKFQVSEIARMFGAPPHLIQDTEKESSWGTGIEQQQIAFVTYTLKPWLSRIEGRSTKELLPKGTYAEFKVEGLMRGDSRARAEFYKQMVTLRAMNPNDVRDLENMEPYEGGDEFLVSTQLVPEHLLGKIGGKDGKIDKSDLKAKEDDKDS